MVSLPALGPAVRSTRVLILGGSTEATQLAHALATRPEIDATLSLAGRTGTPAEQPLPVRIGGFGGVAGLAAYLVDAEIDVLVDATHPFAVRMSAQAVAAAHVAGRRLVVVARPPWEAQDGDRWREVTDATAAALAIGAARRGVFLTVGRLQLAAFRAAPQHRYLVRTIDPVGAASGLTDATFIEARGPFSVADEVELMRAHAIEVLVTKNSGGTAARAKLDAARALGVPVILVARPPGPPVGVGADAALTSILAHAGLAPRGV